MKRLIWCLMVCSLSLVACEQREPTRDRGPIEGLPHLSKAQLSPGARSLGSRLE